MPCRRSRNAAWSLKSGRKITNTNTNNDMRTFHRGFWTQCMYQAERIAVSRFIRLPSMHPGNLRVRTESRTREREKARLLRLHHLAIVRVGRPLGALRLVPVDPKRDLRSGSVDLGRWDFPHWLLGKTHNYTVAYAVADRYKTEITNTCPSLSRALDSPGCVCSIVGASLRMAEWGSRDNLHYYPAPRSSSRRTSAIYNTAEKKPTYEYLARAITTPPCTTMEPQRQHPFIHYFPPRP